MTHRDKRVECSEAHPGCRALRREARQQGVMEQENLPFMLCPPDARKAALLIHGFTATPWEMRPLAEALADVDIASLVVRLPGHGTSPEDLAGRRWEEWYESCLDGYRVLCQDYQEIFGMGMSTGCLLLLMMARTESINGIVLFSPYLRVLHKLAPYAGLLRWVRPYHQKPAEEELSLHYYNRRPLAGIHQINRLLKTVRSQLHQIVCPVLAFNGEGDRTVDIESGRQLVQLLGSPVKIYERYGIEVPHVLTQDENPCRLSMFTQTTTFIQKLGCLNPESRVR